MSSRPLKVLLVTSWGTQCGIAEYAALLKGAVEGADPGIAILPGSDALNPESYSIASAIHNEGAEIVHLNHHDALHSRWQPTHVRSLRDRGIPVVVTYHDTRETLVSGSKLEALSQIASAVIVHEPVRGLAGPRIYYWRQGIPAAAQHPANYACAGYGTTGWVDGTRYLHERSWKAYPQQPVLGTCGFNFPWKNFDRIAQETEKAGWACVICSTNATEEDAQRWKGFNPSTLVVRGHLPTPTLINYLAGCDATAFMYECANTGTSGAIRVGIAARKPVFALDTCRQFRDLHGELCGVTWVEHWQDFAERLRLQADVRYVPKLVQFAHRDSWAVRGHQHAELYRSLVGDR